LRASIEVADIFRAEGAGYRAAQAGHLSLTQLKPNFPTIAPLVA
jgi:hypothetical protein